MRGLAAQFATEETQVAGGEAACGHSCDCHAGLTCGRLLHPDDDGNRSPHVARTEDGDLVQWSGGCCVDGVPQTTDV